MPHLDISLFGAFAVSVDGDPFTDFATDKIRALLIYLAVESDRPHRRSSLATLLWPGYSDSDALRNLRQALYRLRLALEKTSPDVFANCIAVTRQTVTMQTDHVRIDAIRFENLLDGIDGRDASALGADALARMEEAASLYRGEFLEGFHLDDAEPFEEWQAVQRERYHHRALLTLQQLATAYGDRGDYEAMYHVAARQVALEPWREEAHQQVMQALALNGQRSEALAQYERCCETLIRELGVEPSRQITELYQAIRGGTLTAPARPVSQCEGDAAHGAAAQRGKRLHNLPQFYTPILGRDAETEGVAASLATEHGRLVTLTGAGGSGKTRLAVHVAGTLAQTSDFCPDGIYFVPLAAVDRHELLVSTMASGLGLSLHERAPILSQLIDFLRQKSLLLVLDNFEHLIEGAPVLADVMASAPGIKFLVTSRLPLNLRGEQRFRVEGLRYPDPARPLPQTVAAFEEYSGHRLFVQAAQLVQPGFHPDLGEHTAIAGICQLVRGMPLALEIAATWVRLADCQTIERQIQENLNFLATPVRNVPDRHRSVRAVFDYSWHLLPPSEQRALAQISIFRGDFTLEALLAVTDASVVEAANLLDWSLLQRSSGQRYLLHELLRQYAAEKLRQHSTAELDGNITLAARTAERHSHYYLDLVARKEDELHGPNLPQAQSLLYQSLDNIRQAWHWAVEHDRVADLAGGASGLAHFFSLAGYWQEGESLLAAAVDRLRATLEQASDPQRSQRLTSILGWLQVHQAQFLSVQGKLEEAAAVLSQALTHLQARADGDDEQWYARALNVHADLLRLRGDYEQGLVQLNSALAQFRSRNNRRGEAASLNKIGQIHWHRADYEQALSYQQQALRLERQLEHSRGVARCLSSIGLIYYKQSMYQEALDSHRQALEIARGLGNRGDIARHLSNMGVVHSDRREFDQSQAYYEEALAIDRELGNRLGVAIRQTNLGMIYMLTGQYAKALAATEEAHHLLNEMGHRSGIALTLGNMGVILWHMGDLDTALARHLAALELDEELGNWDCVARHLGNIGVVYVEMGDHERAMQFYERGVDLHRTLNIPFFFCETLVRKATLHLIQGDVDQARRLNDEGMAMARKVGRSETLFDSRLLAARIAAAADEGEKARLVLDDLLSEHTGEREIADIHFERWRALGDSEAAHLARDAYRDLSVRIPNHRYKRRLATLNGLSLDGCSSGR